MLAMNQAAEYAGSGPTISLVRDRRDQALPSLASRIRGPVSRVLQAREHAFFEGDVKDQVYQVETGVVCLYKTLSDGRRQILDFAYPGDLIGLGCLTEHVYSAQAITLTRMHAISAGRLNDMASSDPQVSMQLYRALSQQLVAARDLLVTVGQRNATERLAALLCSLSHNNERNGNNPVRVALPMTRADIADFLSLTIETVSRSFTKLRQTGLIDLAQASLVIIRDLPALERLSAGNSE